MSEVERGKGKGKRGKGKWKRATALNPSLIHSFTLQPGVETARAAAFEILHVPRRDSEIVGQAGGCDKTVDDG